MFMINSGMCLWEWVEVYVDDKCGYKHEFDKYETEN